MNHEATGSDRQSVGGPLQVVFATSERHYGIVLKQLAQHNHVTDVVVPTNDILRQEPIHWRLRAERLRNKDIQGVCRKHSIPVRCEAYLQDGAFHERMRAVAPDLLVVVGWPRRIEQSTLSLFRHGGLNIHPSLLPNLRGADPIFHAVDQGLTNLGVTFHAMTSELDAGGIVVQKHTTLMPNDTYDDVYLRIRRQVNQHLLSAIQRFIRNPKGSPQKGSPSYCKPFRQRHRFLDVTNDARAMERRIRACFSHHSMIAATEKCLFHFNQLVIIGRANLDDSPQGYLREVSKNTCTTRVGQHWVRIKGIKTDSKQSLKTGDYLCLIEDTIKMHKE